MPGPVNPASEEIVRPPIELLLERDFRFDMINEMSDGDQITGVPPRLYSSAYYLRAWKYQRHFARA